MSITNLFRDGFQSLVSGLGLAGDKNYANTYVATAVDRNEADAAYRTTLFRKIVDIPPFDMTREWRAWEAEGKQIELIEAEEMRLGLRWKVRQAMQWGRLYGGAAIFVGIKDQNPTEPLDIESVTQGGLAYLHVVDRFTLTAGEMERDPGVEGYGKPKDYRLPNPTGSALIIHPSRVVRFVGNELPAIQAAAEQGWGDSLWNLVSDAVKRADVSSAGMAALVQEAKRDIVKIKGFMNSIATQEYEERIKRRFQTVATLAAIQNLTLLDAEDEWETRQITFTGLPEIVRTFLSILAGLADIPATRLLGKSPDGMNATGDSDIRNYYDMLKSKQSDELAPALHIIDEAMIRSAVGARDKAIHFNWNPLWQMSPAEKSEVDKRNAETTNIYVGTGLIPDAAMAKGVQNKLVEDGVYPGIEQALEEAEAAGDLPPIEEEREQEAEAAAAQAEATRKGVQPGGKPNLKLVKAGDGWRWAAPDPGLAGRAILDAIALRDATPRSLYVRRDVVNVADIERWAKAQGFSEISDALHVTVAYSTTPIDWMKIDAEWGEDKTGNMTIAAGGPRIVEPLGPEGWKVLFFSSSRLTWRHQEIIQRGASWSWPDYQPHISISKGPMPDGVKPYTGPIILGPEIFEEVKA